MCVCVSVCGKVRFATQALTVSAACSCRFIKLCKTSLCFVLAMLCLLFIMIVSCLIYRDIFILVEPLSTPKSFVVFLGMFKTTYFKNQLVDGLLKQLIY